MLEYLHLISYLVRSKVVILRKFSNGLGDNLLLSILLPYLKERYPMNKIVVETSCPELFEFNPYVDWVTSKHLRTTQKHIKPKYKITPDTKESIYHQLMRCINIDGEAYPQIFLSNSELENIKSKFPSKYIVCCPVGKQTFSANRKEWGIENFQELINIYKDINFVQVGYTNDPLMENVIDGRYLTIRETASLIKNSLFFIGLEGGLMHLAKAVNKKSVIIYGGAILPEISAYNENLNIYAKVSCSPCLTSEHPLPRCASMICMKKITPQYVSFKIKEKFADELKR